MANSAVVGCLARGTVGGSQSKHTAEPQAALSVREKVVEAGRHRALAQDRRARGETRLLSDRLPSSSRASATRCGHSLVRRTFLTGFRSTTSLARAALKDVPAQAQLPVEVAGEPRAQASILTGMVELTCPTPRTRSVEMPFAPARRRRHAE